MNKVTMVLTTLAAVLGVGLVAVPAWANKVSAPAAPGSMAVYDGANLFSADAITEAEKKMSATSFDRGLHFTVDTYKEIPADQKAGYSKDREKDFLQELGQIQWRAKTRIKGPMC